MGKLIDFAGDFADLLEPWAGTRLTGGGDDAEGVYQPGTPSTFDFRATPPQPINQNELVFDDGGRFARSVVKTYTAHPLALRDVVAYGGVEYVVHQFDDRQPLGGYCKAYLVRVQDDN